MITPPYPLHPEPMRKSWAERNPLWKIPLGCLTLLLLLAIFGTVAVTIVVGSFRSSDVYRQALAKATESPQVRERLGEPIKPAWFISGQLNVSGSTGNANLSIPISGPRGRALIRAVAQKNGVWRFSSLEVDLEGQPGKIDLLSIQPPMERDF
jgi:amino acid transporter